MITRQYELEVIAKYEGTHGYGSIYLRAPTVDTATPAEPSKPWWVETSHQGGPLTMHLTPEEMAAVEVGALLRVTIEQMTTVGEFIGTST